MPGFGIAGAHRSGKTTVAKQFALEHGFEYLDANVSGVITDLGYSPKQELPIMERLRVQNAILDSLDFKYQMMDNKSFIVDRTPIDVLGYSMTEVLRSSLDNDSRRAFADHFIRGIEVASRLQGIMLLRPLDHAPESETSAQACPVYMRHVYACIRDVLEQVSPPLYGRTLLGSTDAIAVSERIADLDQLVKTYYQITGQKPWTPNT